MFHLPRRLFASLLLALGLLVGSLSASPALAGPIAPKPKIELKVGDELLAQRDVSLREAVLRKGSRVRIVQIEQQHGRAKSVSLELKDGHVLHEVSIQKLRAHFSAPPAPRR